MTSKLFFNLYKFSVGSVCLTTMFYTCKTDINLNKKSYSKLDIADKSIVCIGSTVYGLFLGIGYGILSPITVPYICYKIYNNKQDELKDFI